MRREVDNGVAVCLLVQGQNSSMYLVHFLRYHHVTRR